MQFAQLLRPDMACRAPLNRPPGARRGLRVVVAAIALLSLDSCSSPRYAPLDRSCISSCARGCRACLAVDLSSAPRALVSEVGQESSEADPKLI